MQKSQPTEADQGNPYFKNKNNIHLRELNQSPAVLKLNQSSQESTHKANSRTILKEFSEAKSISPSDFSERTGAIAQQAEALAISKFYQTEDSRQNVRKANSKQASKFSKDFHQSNNKSPIRNNRDRQDQSRNEYYFSNQQNFQHYADALSIRQGAYSAQDEQNNNRESPNPSSKTFTNDRVNSLNNYSSQLQTQKHQSKRKLQVISTLKKISRAKNQKNQSNGDSQQIDLERNKDLIDYQQTMDPRTQASRAALLVQHTHQPPPQSTKNQFKNRRPDDSSPLDINCDIPEGFATVVHSKLTSQKSNLPLYSQNSMTPSHQHSASHQAMNSLSEGFQTLTLNLIPTSGVSPPVMNRRVKAQGLNSGASYQQNLQVHSQQHQLQNAESSNSSSYQYKNSSYPQSKIITFNNSQYSQKNNSNNNQSVFNQSQQYKLSGAASNNQKSSPEEMSLNQSQQTPMALHSKKLSLQLIKASDSKLSHEQSFKKPPIQLQQMPGNSSQSFIQRDLSASKGRATQATDMKVGSKFPTVDLRGNAGQIKISSGAQLSKNKNQLHLNQTLSNQQNNQLTGGQSADHFSNFNNTQKPAKRSNHQRDLSAGNNILDQTQLVKRTGSNQQRELSSNQNHSVVIIPYNFSQSSQQQHHSRQLTKTQLPLQSQNQLKQYTTINGQLVQEGFKNYKQQTQNNYTMVSNLSNGNQYMDQEMSASPNAITMKNDSFHHKRSETVTEIQNSDGNYGSFIQQNQYPPNAHASQFSYKGSIISQGDEGVNNLSTPLIEHSKLLKIQNQQNLQTTSKKQQSQNSLANFGPDESKSVKKIIKKIALLNNTSSLLQLNLQQVNCTPQHKADKKGKMLVNPLSLIGDAPSTKALAATTKNNKKQSIINEGLESEALKMDLKIKIPNKQNSNQRNAARDTSNHHQPMSQHTSPRSFMIAKDSIQPAEFHREAGDSQLAFMALKKMGARPSNHSSSSNLRISGSYALQINNKNASNTSLHRNLPADFFQNQQQLSQPQSSELVTPEVYSRHQKAVTIVGNAKVQQILSKGKKENYQRNLRNNQYFLDEQLPSENSTGETPSFNSAGHNLNFTYQVVDQSGLKRKLEQQILPAINRQRTLNTDLVKYLPSQSSSSQQQKRQTYTTQNTLQTQQIDQEASQTITSGQQSNGTQKKKYYKMIQKFVNKGPVHQRNFTTQIEPQSKASTFNQPLGETQLSQKFQVKLINTPGLGLKVDPLSLGPQRSEDEISRKESQPHIQLPPSAKQSMNTNGEQHEESPFMNDIRKIQMKEESYSPTQEGSYARKKSVVQSYQTQAVGVQMTPAYDKAVVGNQLQSVLHINQFQQSLDNKSTEDSSKQEFISRYNSGQIPLIHSVASSQMKSHSTNGMPGGNQNFSSLSANNYQQLLQKMISIRESQPGRSPVSGDPLSLKPTSSAKNKLLSSSSGKKATSLIKEDSNEEKSSSNSNSNQEIVVEAQQIRKDDLFTKKLKVLLSSRHKRQKTALNNFVYGRQQSSFVEKRYHEDQKEDRAAADDAVQSQGEVVQGDQDSICSVLVMTERSDEIMSQRSHSQQKQYKDSELLLSDQTLHLKDLAASKKVHKTLDKTKHWLLDSTRFNFDEEHKLQLEREERLRQEQLNQRAARAVHDDISDTVEFDNSSSNGTPDAIKNKDLKRLKQNAVELVEKSGLLEERDIGITPQALQSPKQLLLKESHQSPSMRLSRNNVVSSRKKSTDNFITIELQAEESVVDIQNETIAKELNISLEIDQLISKELIGSSKQPRETEIQKIIAELHEKLNVEVSERVILYPKYKMPTLDNFMQPSYYDTIYMGSQPGQQGAEGQPQLETHFDFN